MTSTVLVGNDKGGTIAAFRLESDGASGLEFHRLADTHVGVGCSTFAVDGDLVYCAVKEPAPAVVTLRLDRESGMLDEVSRREVDDDLAYVSVVDGVALLASYAGGWGASHPVVDGVLGERATRFDNRNMHAALHVDGKAYFASLGDDLVAQFSIADDGQLVPLSEPTVAAPAGSGPRHLVASADGRNVYLLTEFTGEAIRFDREVESGRLTTAEAVRVYDVDSRLRTSTFGADPMEGHLIWCADLALAAGEKWLLCTERTESTVATVGLEGGGRLGEVVALTRTEAQPRGMAVSPDGDLAIVVGERSDSASLYRVDDAGTLVELDRVETGRGPNWVRFV